MKLKLATLHDFETQQLAADILGIDENDYDAIESVLADEFDITMENWHKIVCALALRAANDKCALFEHRRGFLDENNNFYICKVNV